MTVEPALVDQIVADSSGEAGALPLVSTALAATWERRSGGALTGVRVRTGWPCLRRAIARLAEDAWSAMPDATRGRGPAVLLRLVRPDDGAGAEIRLRASPARCTDRGDTATEALGRMVERRLVILGEGTVRDHPRGAAAGMATTCGLARRGRGGSAAPVPSHRPPPHSGNAVEATTATCCAASGWPRRTSGCRPDTSPSSTTPNAASSQRRSPVADRELEAARREARHQSQMNRKLRIRLAAIAVLLVGAIGTGVLAVRQAGRADDAAEAAGAASLLADAERLGA